MYHVSMSVCQRVQFMHMHLCQLHVLRTSQNVTPVDQPTGDIWRLPNTERLRDFWGAAWAAAAAAAAASGFFSPIALTMAPSTSEPHVTCASIVGVRPFLSVALAASTMALCSASTFTSCTSPL